MRKGVWFCDLIDNRTTLNQVMTREIPRPQWVYYVVFRTVIFQIQVWILHQPTKEYSLIFIPIC